MVHTWRKDRQTILELCTFTTYTSCTTSRNAQNHPQAIATVGKGGLQAKPEHKQHAAPLHTLLCSPALQLARVLQKIMTRLPRWCSPSTTCSRQQEEVDANRV